MTGLLKTAAVTLATALTAATASAQGGISIWFESSSHNGRPHIGARYDHHPRHTQPAPRYYQPQETPKQACERLIRNNVPLSIYLPEINTGFIERPNFGCKIRFNSNGNPPGIQAWDFSRSNGYQSYKNAEQASFRPEERAQENAQYRYRYSAPRW